MEKRNSASLDARTRLFLGGACLGSVLATSALEILGIQSVMILLVILTSGLAHRWVRSMRLLWPTVAMVFAVVYLSFDTGQAMAAATKLVNLLTVSFIFFSSVTPQEMGDALRKMHVPYRFSFILTTAMRYVPLIGQKTRNIMDAQQSRGIDLRFRPRNIKNIMALLVPLTIQSFMLAEQLGMAMEMRGFDREGRTPRSANRLQLIDYLVILFSLVLLGLFVGRQMGWIK